MASSGSEPGTDAGRRPVIGLTTYLEQTQCGVWDVPAAFLPRVYFDAVARGGGLAVLIPPQPIDASGADAILDGRQRFCGIDRSWLGGRRAATPGDYRHPGDEQQPPGDVHGLARDRPKRLRQ